MSNESIRITGVAETQRKLYAFSDKLGDRITLIALRSGANFMLKRIRQAAPKKTGRLRKAIVVRNSRRNKRRRNGKVGVYITIKRIKRSNDGKQGEYYNYGRLIESGFNHKTKVGRHARVKGRFFIRRTFYKTRNQAVRLIVRNIETAGRQLAKNL